MIKILYTGAPAFLAPQLDSLKSLGGFISSSEVPNDFLNNVFGGLSQMTIQQNKAEIRVIALQNKTGAAISGVSVHFVYPVDDATPTPNKTNLAEFLIGYKSPTANDCGDLSTEQIANIYASPYSVPLVSAEGLGNALSLPNLDIDQYVVLYIKRKIKPVTIDPEEEIEILEDIFDGEVEKITQENIELVLTWV